MEDVPEAKDGEPKQISTLEARVQELKTYGAKMKRRAQAGIDYAFAVKTCKESEDKLVANTNSGSWWGTGVRATYNHCITSIKQPTFD